VRGGDRVFEEVRYLLLGKPRLSDALCGESDNYNEHVATRWLYLYLLSARTRDDARDACKVLDCGVRRGATEPCTHPCAHHIVPLVSLSLHTDQLAQLIKPLTRGCVDELLLTLPLNLIKQGRYRRGNGLSHPVQRPPVTEDECGVRVALHEMVNHVVFLLCHGSTVAVLS
jgi:hypothetical protein